MKNLYIISVLFLLGSCKTISVADFEVKNPNANKISGLIPIIDTGSFLNFFNSKTAKIYSVQNATSDNSITNSILTNNTNISMSVNNDKRLNDTRVIFENEVNQNITILSDSGRGYITCRISINENNIKGTGWIAANSFTFLLPYYFGAPLYYDKTEVQLEVKISNLKRKVLGTYIGTGVSVFKNTLYKNNYNNDDTKRRSQIEAIKIAMESIKNQINNDANRINSLLVF